MRDLTDEALFPLMSAGDTESARQAFDELYRRHAGFLYKSFRWVAPAVYYGEDDLLHDTFLKAFEKADHYVSGGLDAEHSCRRVRAWLSAISNNLIRDNWPRDRQGVVRITQLTHECWEAVAKQPQSDTAAPARVRAALGELSDRDRELILIYMHWYDPELKKQRVPRWIVDPICKHYGLSRPNFRQIVSRTLGRLELALGEQE